LFVIVRSEKEKKKILGQFHELYLCFLCYQQFRNQSFFFDQIDCLVLFKYLSWFLFNLFPFAKYRPIGFRNWSCAF